MHTVENVPDAVLHHLNTLPSVTSLPLELSPALETALCEITGEMYGTGVELFDDLAESLQSFILAKYNNQQIVSLIGTMSELADSMYEEHLEQAREDTQSDFYAYTLVGKTETPESVIADMLVDAEYHCIRNTLSEISD